MLFIVLYADRWRPIQGQREMIKNEPSVALKRCRRILIAARCINALIKTKIERSLRLRQAHSIKRVAQ